MMWPHENAPPFVRCPPRPSDNDPRPTPGSRGFQSPGPPPPFLPGQYHRPAPPVFNAGPPKMAPCQFRPEPERGPPPIAMEKPREIPPSFLPPSRLMEQKNGHFQKQENAE